MCVIETLKWHQRKKEKKRNNLLVFELFACTWGMLQQYRHGRHDRAVASAWCFSFDWTHLSALLIFSFLCDQQSSVLCVFPSLLLCYHLPPSLKVESFSRRGEHIKRTTALAICCAHWHCTHSFANRKRASGEDNVDNRTIVQRRAERQRKRRQVQTSTSRNMKFKSNPSCRKTSQSINSKDNGNTFVVWQWDTETHLHCCDGCETTGYHQAWNGTDKSEKSPIVV